MSRLNPHIRFPDGKCREGMEFYKSIFGGKLEIMTMGESPMVKDFPQIPKDNVMHASLDAGEIYIMGADQMRDPIKVGDQVSLMVECKNEKEVDDLFDKMSKGGEIFMKPEKMFWGGYFGTTTDKYGVEWSFHCQLKK